MKCYVVLSKPENEVCYLLQYLYGVYVVWNVEGRGIYHHMPSK